MNVVVDQLLTNYNLTGKGRLVLLLHGWGDTAEGLNNLQNALAADYQVLAPDLPGFGSTQAPKAAWDLDNYSNFIAELLKKLDLKQPYAVIGHSNGGAIALRATNLGHLKPQKLILIAAAGVRTHNVLKRYTLNVIAKTGNLATLWMPERYRQALRQSLYGAAGSDMLAVPGLEETFKKTVRQDLQTDAEAIKLPTLLIYSAGDQSTPIRDGRLYHELIKGSKLEIIEMGGHFVHLDQADLVIKHIKEFLV